MSNYVCEECGKTFLTGQGLGGHKAAHNRARKLAGGGTTHGSSSTSLTSSASRASRKRSRPSSKKQAADMVDSDVDSDWSLTEETSHQNKRRRSRMSARSNRNTRDEDYSPPASKRRKVTKSRPRSSTTHSNASGTGSNANNNNSNNFNNSANNTGNSANSSNSASSANNNGKDAGAGSDAELAGEETDAIEYSMYEPPRAPFGFPLKPPSQLEPPTEMDALREQIGLAVTFYHLDTKRLAQHCDVPESVFLKWLQSGIPESDTSHLQARDKKNNSNNKEKRPSLSLSPRITRAGSKTRDKSENDGKNGKNGRNAGMELDANGGNNAMGPNGVKNGKMGNLEANGVAGESERYQMRVGVNEDWLPQLDHTLKKMKKDEFDGSNEKFVQREQFVTSSNVHLNASLCQRLNKKMKLWFENFLENGFLDPSNLEFVHDYGGTGANNNNNNSNSKDREQMLLDQFNEKYFSHLMLAATETETAESRRAEAKQRLLFASHATQSNAANDANASDADARVGGVGLAGPREMTLDDDSSAAFYYNSNPRLNFAKTAGILAPERVLESAEQKEGALRAAKVAKEEALLVEKKGLGSTRLLPIEVSESMGNTVEINEKLLWDPGNSVELLRAFIEDLCLEHGQQENNRLKSKIFKSIQRQIEWYLDNEKKYFVACCQLSDRLQMGPSNYTQHIANNYKYFGNKSGHLSKIIKKHIQHMKSRKGSKGSGTGNNANNAQDAGEEGGLLESNIGSVHSKDYEISVVSNLLKLRPYCHGYILIRVEIVNYKYQTPLKFEDNFIWNMNDEFYYSVEAPGPHKRRGMDVYRLGADLQQLPQLEAALADVSGHVNGAGGWGSTIEEFSDNLCAEFGLPNEFRFEIAYEVRKQMLEFQSQTLECLDKIEKAKEEAKAVLNMNEKEIGLQIRGGKSMFERDVATHLNVYDPINFEYIRKRTSDEEVKKQMKKRGVMSEKRLAKVRLEASVWQPKLFTKE